MAVCSWCDQEMKMTPSCTVRQFHLAGEPFDLAPFRGRRKGNRCGDCGVERGGFHHPGCDLQRCPRCARQLMNCGCRFDEDGDDDDWYDADDWDELGEPIGIDGNGLPMERRWIDGEEVIVHYDDVPEGDRTVLHGIPVTTALRTVIDIAPDLDDGELARIVSDFLERELFTVEEAWNRLSQPDMTTRPGALRLRAVLPEQPGTGAG